MKGDGWMWVGCAPLVAMATLARSFHPVSCRETCTVMPSTVRDSTRMPLLIKWSQPGAPCCQRATPFSLLADSTVGGRRGAGIFLTYIAATYPILLSEVLIKMV